VQAIRAASRSIWETSMRILLFLLTICSASIGLITIASAQTEGSGVVGNNYESFTAFAGCPASPFCRIIFPANATGKVVLVTNVSCFVSSSKRPITIALGSAATATSDLVKSTLLPIEDVYLDGMNYITNLNAAARLLVGAGKVPAVAVIAAGLGMFTATGRCYLYGTLVP
jgi:hypothetical protein